MNLLNKQVRTKVPIVFRQDTYANPGVCIGRVIYEEEHETDEIYLCLIRLNSKFVGWNKKHAEQQQIGSLKLEEGYTYWWLNVRKIEPLSTMETE